jgi:hypothetical protein
MEEGVACTVSIAQLATEKYHHRRHRHQLVVGSRSTGSLVASPIVAMHYVGGRIRETWTADDSILFG